MSNTLERPAIAPPTLRQLWADFGPRYAANGFIGWLFAATAALVLGDRWAPRVVALTTAGVSASTAIRYLDELLGGGNTGSTRRSVRTVAAMTSGVIPSVPGTEFGASGGPASSSGGFIEIITSSWWP